MSHKQTFISRRKKAPEVSKEKLLDHLQNAWAVIANASNWYAENDPLTMSKEDRMWIEAAVRWRDEWHAILSHIYPEHQAILNPEE